MSNPLIFVVAPATALPDAATSLDELKAAQRQGPHSGFALRLFTQGRIPTGDLAQLPFDGRLTGEKRRSSDGCQLIADAVVTHFEPQQNWLGIYQSSPEAELRFECLDRFALSEAAKETCWFYPTHDGTYLSWQQGLQLVLSPGKVADGSLELLNAPYARSQVAVLWSLLGDDPSLSCVGLTYGGRRIEWLRLSINPEPAATWSRFCVNSQAELSPFVEESQVVFTKGYQ